MGDEVVSSPAVAGVVVNIGRGDSRSAYDAWTGTKKWAYATQKSAQDSSPAVANGVVYIGRGSELPDQCIAVNGKISILYYLHFHPANQGSYPHQPIIPVSITDSGRER